MRSVREMKLTLSDSLKSPALCMLRSEMSFGQILKGVSFLMRPCTLALVGTQTYGTYILGICEARDSWSFLTPKGANMGKESLFLPSVRPDGRTIGSGPRVCRSVQMGLPALKFNQLY